MTIILTRSINILSGITLAGVLALLAPQPSARAESSERGKPSAPAAQSPASSQTNPPASGPRAGNGVVALDLKPFYTHPFPESHSGYREPALEALPKGEHVIDGLPFNVAGQIRFYGEMEAGRGKVHPKLIEGIPVNHAFEELHLIHHTAWPDAEGQTMARVRLNYADGARHEIPIRFGEHVRDWYRLPSEEKEQFTDPSTKIIWRGTHANAAKWKSTLRLSKSVLLNPHLEKQVRTIDFIAADSKASYALLAATIAPRDAGRPVTPPVPPLEERPEFDGAIKISVVDRDTGKPIEGAMIDLGMQVDGAGVAASPVYTDGKGEATVRYPDGRTGYIWVTAKRRGYSSESLSWDSGGFPKTHTFRLTAAVEMGGIVKDESGRPVADAAVYLSGEGVGQDKTHTDAAGHWTLASAPKGLTEFSVVIDHVDYPRTYFQHDQRDSAYAGPRVPMKELLAKTAVLTLPRGVTLSGTISNTDGQPLANAEVLVGASRYHSDAKRARTDAQGKFQITGLRPGNNTVTVKAAGHSPEMREIATSADGEPFQIALEKGRVVKGRVVDAEGKPVAGATVALEFWRSKQTLDWRVTTDNDGRFESSSAPLDQATVSILKQGYATLRQVRLKPGEEQTLTLPPQGVVKGHVVDEETKKPIATFRVTPGQQFGPDHYGWQSYRTIHGRDGEFQLTLDEAGGSFAVKVEAEGYLPALSGDLTPSQGVQLVNIELRKGRGPSGVVKLPDGRPAAGAEVTLATRSRNFELGGRRKFSPRTGEDQKIAVTGDDGSFQLPPQLEAMMLVAVHEQGYAEIPAEALGQEVEVQLQPWGRIEGKVHAGAKLLPDATVVLTRDDQTFRGMNYSFQEFQAKTDSEGRFVIENVPPGRQRVARLLPIGENRWRYSHSTRVTVAPGGVTRMMIGGTGRAVKGKVAITNYDGPVDWNLGQVSLVTSMPRPPQRFKTEEEYEAWVNSPEVVKARENQRAYAVIVTADGAFHVDDVEPGDYDFRLYLQRPGSGGFGVDYLATHSQEVKVPANPLGEDKPLDIGLIEASARKEIKIGEAAPLFEAKTVEGEPFKLSDFKGKYVLLDFWATWCGPCLAETPNLKAVWESFGKDDRFAMIGLSVDDDAAPPKDYAKKNGLEWIQGHLGDWTGTQVPSAYGVYGIPSIFLIGPDGNILAKNLRGPDIMNTVQQVLQR